MALSVAQLYEVMTQLPDPVFILSEDGHYIEYIGGVEQQSYQDGNPLIGKRLFDVLPADKAFWVMEQVARALAGGHVDVFTGDVTEARRALAQGVALRVLAVLAPQRLGADAAGWPTAREQAVDLVWPTVRGLYMGLQAPEAVGAHWQAVLCTALQSPGYAARCRAHGLEPLALVGPALHNYLGHELQRYQALMATLGLRRWSRG